jgi:U3 small nucleolar RNA-associated protein MPP10
MAMEGADGEPGVENNGNNDVFGDNDPMDEDSEVSDDAEDGVFEEMREQEMNANENDEQIDELEQKLLSDKPWQMKGEIRAMDRPKNGLLDVQLDFEHGVELKEKKDVEVIASIEDMIKQRILTEAFDDPREVIVDYSLNDPTVKPDLDY